MYRRKSFVLYRLMMAIGINGLFLFSPLSETVYFWFSKYRFYSPVFSDNVQNDSALRIENEYLKAQLRSKEALMHLSSQEYECIYADVLHYEPENGLMRISAKSDHLQKYMAVMVQDGLVGKIIEVDGTEALVETLYRVNYDSEWSVRVQINETQWTYALIKGQRSYQCEAVLLEQIPVEKGMHVLTSGYSSMIPEGLVVGTISEVLHSSTQLRILIEPSASMMMYDAVCVVRKSS